MFFFRKSSPDTLCIVESDKYDLKRKIKNTNEHASTRFGTISKPG